MTDATPRFLTYDPEPLLLDDEDARFPRRHVFAENDVHAINAALAAGRPLLLRGAPGTGKSQLALAAAVGLGRAFVSHVIDARSESRDLLWRYDAVRRLADAQVAAQPGRLDHRKQWLREDEDDVLHERFYTAPGPLWWAFAWSGAETQAGQAGGDVPPQRPGADPANGVVVLLDEIDKADPSLPNGLLGVLGDGRFAVPGVGEVACEGVPPLVVVTTNDERSLPEAFLRRCAAHRLALDEDPQGLREWLKRLGEAHFPEKQFPRIDDTVLEGAADMLVEDRRACQREEVHPPGSAEYLDLLRVVAARDDQDPKELLGVARRFLLRKQAWTP